MAEPASPDHPPAHHKKIRRAKRFLRYMPRRAVMHRYPLIGRFARTARERAYLWSFKTAHVRPALYIGSIISLLPIMGVQLPVTFALSLFLRLNFMVMAGLQFITNPFTAAPIYYGTYQLGRIVIEASGFGDSIEFTPEPGLALPAGEIDAPPVTPGVDTPAEIHWTSRLGTSINALVIGGVISGLALGALLDLGWKLGSRRKAALARQI